MLRLLARPVGATFVAALMVVALVPFMDSPAQAFAGDASMVFFNEIHYEGSEGEFFELAAPAGTSLDGFFVDILDENGLRLRRIDVSGAVFTDQLGGYGTVQFLVAGLPDGPTGLALFDENAGPTQFLSFGAGNTPIVGASGVVDGLTATDIGVSEGPNDPAGSSLQLVGAGTTAGDFTWTAPSAASPGSPNSNQEFGTSTTTTVALTTTTTSTTTTTTTTTTSTTTTTTTTVPESDDQPGDDDEPGDDDRPTLFCMGREATIVGTDGDDVLRGTDGDDVIVGLGGNDHIRAGRGDDIICAGDGNDLVRGGSGNDVIDGGAGRDSINGGSGDDLIDGGDDDDRLWGSRGDDEIDGGDGHDYVDGGSGNDSLSGSAGNDKIKGGRGSDTINGGHGNDKLYGKSGDDIIDGGEGTDKINGGSGTDTCTNGESVTNCGDGDLGHHSYSRGWHKERRR